MTQWSPEEGDQIPLVQSVFTWVFAPDQEAHRQLYRGARTGTPMSESRVKGHAASDVQDIAAANGRLCWKAVPELRCLLSAGGSKSIELNARKVGQFARTGQDLL